MNTSIDNYLNADDKLNFINNPDNLASLKQEISDRTTRHSNTSLERFSKDYGVDDTSVILKPGDFIYIGEFTIPELMAFVDRAIQSGCVETLPIDDLIRAYIFIGWSTKKNKLIATVDIPTHFSPTPRFVTKQQVLG